MPEIPLNEFSRMLNTHPVVLLSSRLGRHNTVMPLTWYVPLSMDPPMIGISLKPSSQSCHNIRVSGDFILAVPDSSHLKEVHFCGLHSGRDVDKICALSLNTTRAKSASPLMLVSCLANIECRVRDVIQIGNRPFFTAELLALTANTEYYREGWLEESAHLIYHEGGSIYRVNGQLVDMNHVNPGYVPPNVKV